MILQKHGIFPEFAKQTTNTKNGQSSYQTTEPEVEETTSEEIVEVTNKLKKRKSKLVLIKGAKAELCHRLYQSCHDTEGVGERELT